MIHFTPVTEDYIDLLLEHEKWKLFFDIQVDIMTASYAIWALDDEVSGLVLDETTLGYDFLILWS